MLIRQKIESVKCCLRRLIPDTASLLVGRSSLRPPTPIWFVVGVLNKECPTPLVYQANDAGLPLTNRRLAALRITSHRHTLRQAPLSELP
jgi:hypothetical protein